MTQETVLKPVKGSKTAKPVMVLLDLLGRRWTLRVMWELRHGPLNSRALREACDDVSPTVLQARLTELRAAGFVDHRPGEGYRLTDWGREMNMSFLPLYGFAERWARERAKG